MLGQTQAHSDLMACVRRGTHLAVIDENVEESIQEEDPVGKNTAGVKQHWLQGRGSKGHYGFTPVVNSTSFYTYRGIHCTIHDDTCTIHNDTCIIHGDTYIINCDTCTIHSDFA